jgi:hypothetical protein
MPHSTGISGANGNFWSTLRYIDVVNSERKRPSRKVLIDQRSQGDKEEVKTAATLGVAFPGNA